MECLLHSDRDNDEIITPVPERVPAIREYPGDRFGAGLYLDVRWSFERQTNRTIPLRRGAKECPCSCGKEQHEQGALGEFPNRPALEGDGVHYEEGECEEGCGTGGWSEDPEEAPPDESEGKSEGYLVVFKDAWVEEDDARKKDGDDLRKGQ